MAAESVTSLKEGMKITKKRLEACGCLFIKSSSLSSEVFEKDGQFIFWDIKTKKIWRIIDK